MKYDWEPASVSLQQEYCEDIADDLVDIAVGGQEASGTSYKSTVLYKGILCVSHLTSPDTRGIHHYSNKYDATHEKGVLQFISREDIDVCEDLDVFDIDELFGIHDVSNTHDNISQSGRCNTPLLLTTESSDRGGDIYAFSVGAVERQELADQSAWPRLDIPIRNKLPSLEYYSDTVYCLADDICDMIFYYFD